MKAVLMYSSEAYDQVQDMIKPYEKDDQGVSRHVVQFAGRLAGGITHEFVSILKFGYGSQSEEQKFNQFFNDIDRSIITDAGTCDIFLHMIRPEKVQFSGHKYELYAMDRIYECGDIDMVLPDICFLYPDVTKEEDAIEFRAVMKDITHAEMITLVRHFESHGFKIVGHA